MNEQEYNAYIKLFKDFTLKEMEDFKKMVDVVYIHYLRCLSTYREDPEKMDLENAVRVLIEEAGKDEQSSVIPVLEKFRSIK